MPQGRGTKPTRKEQAGKEEEGQGPLHKSNELCLPSPHLKRVRSGQIGRDKQTAMSGKGVGWKDRLRLCV